MVLVTDECARLLTCRIKSLGEKLNHPSHRRTITMALIGRKVRTTYRDANGLKHTFFIADISKNGADSILAYGQLRRPFNVNVAAYFYTRHRIRLMYHYLPCIVERIPGCEDRHYPMELLELLDNDDEEQKTKQWWLDPILKGESLETLKEENEESSSSSSSNGSDYLIFEGRDECSQ